MGGCRTPRRKPPYRDMHGARQSVRSHTAWQSAGSRNGAPRDGLAHTGLRRVSEYSRPPSATRIGRRESERDSVIDHLTLGTRGGPADETTPPQVHQGFATGVPGFCDRIAQRSRHSRSQASCPPLCSVSTVCSTTPYLRCPN